MPKRRKNYVFPKLRNPFKQTQAALIIALLGYWLIVPVDAKQLSFQRVGQKLHYVWQIGETQPQQATFGLQQYPRNLSFFTAFRPQAANAFIARGLQDLAQEQDPKKAIIDITTYATRLSWEIRTHSPSEQQSLNQQLNTIYKKRYDEYLVDHRMLLLKMPSGKSGIIPNHPMLAQQSAPYLEDFAVYFFPKSTQVNSHTDLKKQLDTLLAFIQSIPYNELQTKGQYRGAGFMTPIQVLRNNMGDCDSKATLLAAILLKAKPQLKTAFVYIPEHAFLAIQLPATGDEQTVKIEQQPWLVMDPTGPTIMPVGKVSLNTLRYIKSNYFKTLPVNNKQTQ